MRKCPFYTGDLKGNGMRYSVIYRVVNPVFGSLWRILRIYHLVVMWIRYHKNFHVSIFKPGKGIHYKWLLTSSRDGKLYLVKTTSALIEWWGMVVLNWKKENGMALDYNDLDFERIMSDITALCAIPSLRRHSLIHDVSIQLKEIWYSYLPDALPVSQNDSKYLGEISEISELMHSHGFESRDCSIDNHIVVDGRVYIIDLESIVRLNSVGAMPRVVE